MHVARVDILSGEIILDGVKLSGDDYRWTERIVDCCQKLYLNIKGEAEGEYPLCILHSDGKKERRTEGTLVIEPREKPAEKSVSIEASGNSGGVPNTGGILGGTRKVVDTSGKKTGKQRN
jgi:hypothetical protein